MGDVKVAVHQPNYLPWLGFFHKISRVDTFVFLDTVQFARRGYTHRVYVMGPGGDALWLTESVSKRAVEEQVIQDLVFSDKHWVDKHLKTLDAVYRKTPYFDAVFALVECGLRSDTDFLGRFNGSLIQMLAKAVGISTRILYASELDLGDFSSPNERIARITNHLGGKLYLSGAGARAYNDPDVFARHGVELSYNDFVIEPYAQRNPRSSPQFMGGLSIVDALFNVGFGGVAAMLDVPQKNVPTPQADACQREPGPEVGEQNMLTRIE